MLCSVRPGFELNLGRVGVGLGQEARLSAGSAYIATLGIDAGDGVGRGRSGKAL